jgi:hypothetical protein
MRPLDNGQWTHPDRKLGLPVYYIPVIKQIDDVSGNKSKKWNIHYAISYANATLDRKTLHRERSIKFFAISQHATPLELCEAWSKQMKYIVSCHTHM